ncbi:MULTISPECIES: hypothetical protein [unclassified Streptomyces]|uniref:hypothetical protein n=1 Tax=unclassified Streptomyces TaxID=2593676 RepID=UPI0037F7E0F7
MARRRYSSSAVHTGPHPSTEVAHDRRWAKDAAGTVRCSAALLALLLLVDACAGSLTPARSVLWVALALLLFTVLYPTRVSAGRGWLASRGLLREQRVRTDLLVSVCCLEDVGRRLVLRDVFGGRVELDTQVLTANPQLWYRLAEDARGSATRGSLASGERALRRVAERIDRETAQAVFEVSGLA